MLKRYLKQAMVTVGKASGSYRSSLWMGSSYSTGGKTGLGLAARLSMLVRSVQSAT